MEWVGVAQDLIMKWITSRTAFTYTSSNVVLEGRYVRFNNMILESRSQCSAQIAPDASLAKQTPKAITAILLRTLTWRCHPTISITVNQLSPETAAHRYYRYTNSANIGVSLNAYPSGNYSVVMRWERDIVTPISFSSSPKSSPLIADASSFLSISADNLSYLSWNV